MRWRVVVPAAAALATAAYLGGSLAAWRWLCVRQEKTTWLRDGEPRRQLVAIDEVIPGWRGALACGCHPGIALLGLDRERAWDAHEAATLAGIADQIGQRQHIRVDEVRRVETFDDHGRSEYMTCRSADGLWWGVYGLGHGEFEARRRTPGAPATPTTP